MPNAAQMALVKSTRITVAAAQMKFRADIEDNVDYICEAIRTSGRAGADIILFPECAVTGYQCDFTAVSQREVEAAFVTIGRAARGARCHVLVGGPTWRGTARFNSLLVFNRQGR